MKAVTFLNKQEVLIYELVVCYFHLLGKKTPLQDFFPIVFTFVEGDNTLPSILTVACTWFTQPFQNCNDAIFRGKL